MQLGLFSNSLPSILCLKWGVYGCDKTLRPKVTQGGMIYLTSQLSGHSASPREVRAEIWKQELKQKIQRNTLYSLPQGLFSLISYTTQSHLFRIGAGGPQGAGILPHQSLINQEKYLQNLSLCQLYGAFFSHLRFHLPRGIQVCVKLTK